jgi:hypothetical protein
MLREIAQIILAIHLSSPKLPDARTKAYANTMQQEADKNDIDPLMIVAIAEHESQFNERAISADGEDYGLMQIRARYYGGKSQWLLNGENNIRVGSYLIKRAISFCRVKLKREPLPQEWLSVYQGSIPSCKPTKLTRLVADYADCLVQNVEGGAEAYLDYDCRSIYYGK